MHGSRLLATVVSGLILAAAAFGIYRLRSRIEGGAAGRRSKAALVAAAVFCIGVFILLNVLDWPGGVLTTFWAEHPIVAASASTLPLVGAGYFAFTAYDIGVQNSVDAAITANGRSGVVDHLVDIDVALSLLGRAPADVTGFSAAGRPLRWLRDWRPELGGELTKPRDTDPRSASLDRDLGWAEFRATLIDQCVRRVMGGVRDWGPVLALSRDGRADLVAFASIRRQLVNLTEANVIRSTEVNSIQQTCRSLALKFEHHSRSTPRPEVLHESW